MLIFYEDSRAPYTYLVGVAVIQWPTDDGLRTYVVYPVKDGSDSYVEVEIAFGSEDLKTIKPPLKAWQSLKDAFGDDSEGYSCDNETVQDLYDVWDDGAKRHPEAARRLYEKYKPLIDTYAEDAIQFMNKRAAEEYDQKLKEAKANGWDTALVAQPEPISFPYEA